MKRKLITLFVALIVLAGFKAYAADPILVGVSTGRAEVPSENNPRIGYVSPVTGNPGYDNERGGYAGTIVELPNKLSFNAAATDATKKFVYKAGEPKTNYGSPDRIYVNNPDANYVSFANSAGTLLTLKDGEGTSHSKFVVFRSRGATYPAGAVPGPYHYRVLDYYSANQGRTQNIQNQVVEPQDFNGGEFEGFLGIQAGGYVDDADLYIVVHNKQGDLSLMRYGAYVDSLCYNNGGGHIVNGVRNNYYPLYVKSEIAKARWARQSDFEDCRFYEFFAPNVTMGENKKTLTVYNARETEARTSNVPFSVFAAKQVDYVQNGVSTGPNPNPNNLIGNDADFQGLNHDLGGSHPWNYGTTYNTTTPADVIPLFTLSTPENNCQVLSISRQNDFRTESQANGVLASKLEVRKYGEYYRYTGTNRTYSSVELGCSHENYVKYTSLQKFAIWMDIDGYFTLYPVAAYLWNYGDTETQRKDAPDNILPNSAVMYNDIHVRYTPYVDPIEYANKQWGTQIGYWNGKRTTPAGDVEPYIGTVPNNLQTNTDYDLRAFEAICKDDPADLSGRFYFLQVYVDTLGAWRGGDAWNYAFARTGSYNYNYQREYVLSTQLAESSGTVYKRLVAVPKEQVRTSDPQYWRFPYDSVNMAAHWEIQKKADGYLLINMLGDTLQYNIDFSQTGPPIHSPANYISGGFLPVNGLWPGANGCDAGVKYFGNPRDAAFAPFPWYPGNSTAHWFDWNPIGADFDTPLTWNTWKFYKLQDNKQFGMDLSVPSAPKKFDKDAFFMELNIPASSGYTVRLKEDKSAWYNGYGGMIGANVGRTYWQRNVDLEFIDNKALNEYACGSDIPSCFGLLVKLAPIYYVPNHGTYYPGDRTNKLANTVDVDTVNTNYSKFQKQDSLTAYTFLEGYYDLKEALDVENKLIFGSRVSDSYDATIGDVNAACLVNNESGLEAKLQFIPLNSAKGVERNKLIDEWIGDDATMDYSNGIDTLYGEKYKWYLVYNTELKKYMTFDTVNVSAGVNREKVGFVFDADLVNSTPVRLYQPLVGDKANDNFLIQFYMPAYTYHYGTGANSTKKYATPNTFPDIESNQLGDYVVPSYAGVAGFECATNEVCFATLINQSDYIFATRAYARTTTATRFTIVVKDMPVCPCIGEFIKPQWMGQERLLNLPLNNRIWVGEVPVDAWIATGLTAPTNSLYLNSTLGGKSAIVSNDLAATASAELTHTYVATIKPTMVSGSLTGSVYIPVPLASPSNAQINNATISGFQKDTIVPLYYIQNEAQQYLTVVPKCDLQDERSTTPDVSGVKLEWRPKTEWGTNNYTNYGYDPRVFQLFAISGCEKDPVNGQYGKFIYLPLASYVQDYITGTIVQNSLNKGAVSYNFNLGKTMINEYGCIGNDVRDCYRISQYTTVNSTVKDLIVFNSKTASEVGSFVPIEFKLSRQQYIKPDCDYYLVQNIGSKAVYGGKFYSFDDNIAAANKYSLFAHWQIGFNDAKDEYLATFIPELEDVYGVKVGIDEPIPQTQLTGDYYFVKEVTSGGKKGYQTIDVSGYLKNDFTPVYDTLQLTCIDHAVPFFDLEADGGFNLLNRLAILEAPFVDRNITYTVDGEMTPIYRGNQLIGYQAYINRIGNEFDKAEYLSVYRENRRQLSDHHIIPYYSFSITKKEAGKDVEYFMNVDLATNINHQDSVYWTKISNEDKLKLIDWEENPDFLPTYKFCLPYQVKEDGTFESLVKYGDAEYPRVYLQTLDLAVNDYPYLIIAGAATKYVTSKNLYDAIRYEHRASTLKWNIYSIDYRYIDEKQVTAWIFGGKAPHGNIWVPIWTAIEEGSAEGLLTNHALAGVTFVDQSNKTPVNYGTTTGLKNAPNLTVEFEGDTVIGAYALRPIWYYRIKIEDESGEKYLTDATELAKTNSDYYNYQVKQYPFGFFGDKLNNYAPYVAEDINADRYFVQAFGFRYVIDDSDAEQSFYVVSNANYRNKPTKENEYRFLASINNQFVFVDDPADALVFQWGGRDEDGEYVDLKIVGKAGIFGVEGGIKFLNTTGKVDIYAIDGRLIKSAVVTGAEQTIAVPRGVAVVKAGSKAVRVVVQ